MSIYVIAEIGINHNGDLSIAKDLIKVASDCGCDAVKFQKRDINLVYTKEYLDSPRESKWGTTQRDQKAGLEFGQEEYQSINSFCNELSIDWFASAWDLNSQKFLSKFDLKYNKIASPMLVYKELLEMVASEGKHTFISTGMSKLSDIDMAVNIFKSYKCSFELMHCVSTYPMNDETANLEMINTLRNLYKCKVGYSGHEAGVAISCGAAAFNISSLERHITLDRGMYGTDQAASLEATGLRFLVGAVRKIDLALGNGEKQFLAEEKKNAEKLRQHLILNN